MAATQDDSVTPADSEGKTTGQPRQIAAAVPATDTGWAWAVLAGTFVVYFTAIGSTVSFTVYLPVWMDYYDSNSATTSLVLSICTLMRGLLSKLFLHTFDAIQRPFQFKDTCGGDPTFSF